MAGTTKGKRFVADRVLPPQAATLGRWLRHQGPRVRRGTAQSGELGHEAPLPGTPAAPRRTRFSLSEMSLCTTEQQPSYQTPAPTPAREVTEGSESGGRVHSAEAPPLPSPAPGQGAPRPEQRQRPLGQGSDLHHSAGESGSSSTVMHSGATCQQEGV